MHKRRMTVTAAVFFALAAFSWGCTDADPFRPEPQRAEAPAPAAPGKPDAPAAAGPGESSDESLRDRGRVAYMVNCSACHNPDPDLAGNLGPPVAGASLALLEARLLHNTYPEGYTPKRDSRVMMALPYLKDEIPSLAAYLAQ